MELVVDQSGPLQQDPKRSTSAMNVADGDQSRVVILGAKGQGEPDHEEAEEQSAGRNPRETKHLYRVYTPPAKSRAG